MMNFSLSLFPFPFFLIPYSFSSFFFGLFFSKRKEILQYQCPRASRILEPSIPLLAASALRDPLSRSLTSTFGPFADCSAPGESALIYRISGKRCAPRGSETRRFFRRQVRSLVDSTREFRIGHRLRRSKIELLHCPASGHGSRHFFFLFFFFRVNIKGGFLQ
ncbi:hypothetical protein GGR50DRAFT_644369 [Xylaria sp. CBS 124048]|nr:hypothetical protein GGR50DRAFT_644369 [Xylaria sp. CBS 124048]